VDRLILEKLTDMDAVVKLGDLADQLSGEGLGLATVRALLASNPERFAYHERRWIPAARLEGQGRPFAEAMKLVLDRFGAPLSLFSLAGEIGRIRREPIEEVEPIVRRIIETNTSFTIDSKSQKVALTSWCFNSVDDPLDRALGLNGVTNEELEAAEAKLKDFDWRAPDAVERALKAAAPIRAKVLGAVAYASYKPWEPRAPLMYNPKEFLRKIIQAEGFIYAADGVIHPAEDAKKWITTTARLADKLIPTIEVEEAAPIEIKKDDAAKLVQKVLASEQTTTASRLLEENYEITPSNKTYPDDLSNIMESLRSDNRIQWVGGDRFRKQGDFPEYILEVPEPFIFVESGVKDEEGELVDVELTDEGLSSSLRKLIQHPLAQDVLDEDLAPVPKTMPDSVRLVLKSIHRELGTFPMCQLPNGWLDDEPAVQELIIVDGQGREIQAWLNHDTRLLFGFIDWWFEQPVESGAVFVLTKTNRPNLLEFEWLDQPDPVVFISAQRMEELRRLGAESEGRSTLELLIEVMAHWPKGADYLTVHAELNVVRRTTRRLAASLLSSYQCFYQRSGSPVWHFDQKKVDLGFDKTKRKFVKK
jgi:hypothetical protein